MKKLILILALFLAGMTAFAQDMKTYQYAERDTLNLYLDFYTPETVHDSTICLVYVFGGGFIGGHRDGKWEKAYFKQLVDEGRRRCAKVDLSELYHDCEGWENEKLEVV